MKKQKKLRHRKNKSNHPNFLDHQVLLESSLQNFKRYQTILTLEQKTKKLKKNVLQPETNTVIVETSNTRTREQQQQQQQEEFTSNEFATLTKNVVDKLQENHGVQVEYQILDINNDDGAFEIDNHFMFVNKSNPKT